MDRKHPGAVPPTLDETLADKTPRFDERLSFVFEVIPVVPLLVAPGVTPPTPPLTPIDNLNLVKKPPTKLAPGAVKTGSPINPYFLGQLPPIVIEGHNITHFSVDMATHGFTGSMRFTISDSRLLGDIKDRDKVVRAFRSQNLLMLKLCIRPHKSDQKFPTPLSPVMVPTVIGEVPIPAKILDRKSVV